MQRRPSNLVDSVRTLTMKAACFWKTLISTHGDATQKAAPDISFEVGIVGEHWTLSSRSELVPF
jgi:hypothetical protein